MARPQVTITAEDDGVAAMLAQFSDKVRYRICKQAILSVGDDVARSAAQFAPVRGPTARGGQVGVAGTLKRGLMLSKYWKTQPGSVYKKVIAPTRGMLKISPTDPNYYPAYAEYGHVKYNGAQRSRFRALRRQARQTRVSSAISAGKWRNEEDRLSRLQMAAMRGSRDATKVMHQTGSTSGRVEGSHYMKKAYEANKTKLRPEVEKLINLEIVKVNGMRSRLGKAQDRISAALERAAKAQARADRSMLRAGRARNDKTRAAHESRAARAMAMVSAQKAKASRASARTQKISRRIEARLR